KPDRILGLSAEMIGILPALDDLKKEMIEKQAQFAVTTGLYLPGHPKYVQSQKSIEAMRQQIHLELDLCVTAMRNEVKDAKTRWSRLDKEMNSLDQQLTELSENRTEILTLVAELKERTEIANKAQSNLAEIKSLAEAGVSNLIARVDEPQVSTRPDGPGKKLKILVGGFAGLMLGLGVVLLIAPPMDPEQFGFGGGPDGSGPGSNSPEDRSPRSAIESPSGQYPILPETTGSAPAYGAYGVSSQAPSVADLLAASQEVLPPPVSASQAPVSEPQATGTLPQEVKIRPARYDQRKRRFVVRPDSQSTSPAGTEASPQGTRESREATQPSIETNSVEFVDPRSFRQTADAPTLKRRSPSVRAVDLAKTAASEDAAFQRTVPSDGASTGTANVPPTRDESMGIPEQIQKLSDSIARYANPNPMDSPPVDR
ncbi:hypothetical protein OAK32_02635, partial [Mariniblastus sp.]|nr:hypothetical protein [Mariniblastus sp.]